MNTFEFVLGLLIGMFLMQIIHIINNIVKELISPKDNERSNDGKSE